MSCTRYPFLAEKLRVKLLQLWCDCGLCLHWQVSLPLRLLLLRLWVADLIPRDEHAAIWSQSFRDEAPAGTNHRL